MIGKIDYAQPLEANYQVETRPAHWLMNARLRAIRGAEIVGGELFLTRPVQSLWRVLARLRPKPPGAGSAQSTVGGTAVVAHVYYTEILPEVLACWRNVMSVETTAPLHITTPRAQLEHVQRIIGDLENVYVHVGPNRGRDIAPFLDLLNGGVLDAYDLVLKLHTKRSPHLWGGDLRRRLLFTVLSGNPRQISHIRELFEDPKVGMVGWRLAFRNSRAWWMDNEARVRELVQSMRPRWRAEPGFFEGSMFWVRPASLGAVRSLALHFDDFEPEDGQLDGTLHHAIERMFSLSAWAGGYRVHAISGKVLHAGH
jgi:rhamnosyltransferase